MVNNENKSALRKQYRKERADRFISESWLHILSANEFKDVSKIGSYISYEFEPETSDINQRIIFSGKTLYLPRLLKNNDNRLGQGGGSYDRVLTHSNAWSIALLHRGELTSEVLPVEPHDQKVKAAATPEIIVRF